MKQQSSKQPLIKGATLGGPEIPPPPPPDYPEENKRPQGVPSFFRNQVLGESNVEVEVEIPDRESDDLLGRLPSLSKSKSILTKEGSRKKGKSQKGVSINVDAEVIDCNLSGGLIYTSSDSNSSSEE